jgi:DNA-binding NtrC family response regulator
MSTPSMTANGQKPSILIADDEEMVIASIKAFLQLDDEFEIHGFTDPEEAAKFAAENPVDVAVSDYLMPKMNGIQLLAKIKEVQPEASRVLLTGHADKQSAIQAINQVALFQYLEKPWDNNQLRLVIQSGAERSKLFRSARESGRARYRTYQFEKRAAQVD